jgi:hypothetical protein
MKAFALPLAVAALLGLTGCLTAETQEWSVTLHPDGHRGAYSVTLRNLQADGPTPHHQQQDFDTLVGLLTSDDYLLDRLRDGVYVKSRGVRIEAGILVAKETGLFSDPANVGVVVARDSTLRRSVESGMTVLATNGRVIQAGDSLYVRWPMRTQQMSLKLRQREFQPTASLVAKYRAWKARRR